MISTIPMIKPIFCEVVNERKSIFIPKDSFLLVFISSKMIAQNDTIHRIIIIIEIKFYN